jgi:hypothetical protein
MNFSILPLSLNIFKQNYVSHWPIIGQVLSFLGLGWLGFNSNEKAGGNPNMKIKP